MDIDNQLEPIQLKPKLDAFWQLSGDKIKSIANGFDHQKGSPVITADGVYQPKSWTDWTQGFEFGSALLQFETTGDQYFLDLGLQSIKEKMTSHVAHFGVHDHGFNNHSTYGNLLRLINEYQASLPDWAKEYCILALKLSSSVQARRWTTLPHGGFIYSFNGPHSLFVDTIRTIRILVIGHTLGHQYEGENDLKTSLLLRAYQHAMATAKYNVYYGEGRDAYDVKGRTAHEAIFNTNDGVYRCPSSQQGYSPFSTWTRGLSWAMLGFAEQLEFLQNQNNLPELEELGGKAQLVQTLLKAARATCDFYIQNCPLDGIPYWDTGAPGLVKLDEWRMKKSDPFNDYEPIDSSAACIGAQGLLRLGNYLRNEKDPEAEKYWQAGLTVANHLLSSPYLSESTNHQGLILHSIYHRPNGWDHVPKGSHIPYGESSMWGDYHARELATYLSKMIHNNSYYTFYSGIHA